MSKIGDISPISARQVPVCIANFTNQFAFISSSSLLIMIPQIWLNNINYKSKKLKRSIPFVMVVEIDDKYTKNFSRWLERKLASMYAHTEININIHFNILIIDVKLTLLF